MDQLLAFDATLSRRFSLPLESGWWQLARFTAHLGDGPYVFGGLGTICLWGWFWDKSDTCQAGATIAFIVLTAMLAVTLIKFVVRRERPQPPGEFVTFKYDIYSFPSGHSARLAALAVGVTFFFPGLGWLAGIVTLGVATARVAVGVHFISDVVVGLVVGALVAWGNAIFLQYLLPIPTS
jgi:membrane-associated phospholipid phosphatase